MRACCWIRSLLSTRPHVPLVRSFPRNQRHVASHREGEGVLFGVRKYLRAVTEPHDRRVTTRPWRAPPQPDGAAPRPPLRASADPFRTCVVSTITVFIIAAAKRIHFRIGSKPFFSPSNETKRKRRLSSRYRTSAKLINLDFRDIAVEKDSLFSFSSYILKDRRYKIDAVNNIVAACEEDSHGRPNFPTPFVQIFIALKRTNYIFI